jgi:FO synthase subunit 1
MTLTAAAGLLEPLQPQGICEILILSGEVHPNSARRSAWFQRIYDLCELSLSLGFLPHTNAGPLSYPEMEQLKQVNVSMGLMLEQLTPKLRSTVHQQAPSKIPQVRLEQLEWAGKLQIPFTTGLLLGIGEDDRDWQESLAAIADIHRQYRHIQEVILQPYSFGTTQTWDAPTFHPHRLPEVVAIARQILPPDITIQIPPNLVEDAGWLLACLDAGARDLGGISPKDEVNPDYPHSSARRLQEILETAGWQLVPRLPVYPQYDSWLLERSQIAVRQWRTKTSS